MTIAISKGHFLRRKNFKILKLMRQNKRFVRWSIAFLVTVLVIGSTGIYLNSRLREIIVGEINRQLLVKVKVQNVTVSVFRHFPAVSMRFDEISIPSASGESTKLVEAGRLSIQFSLLDIVRKRYIIRNIEVSDGSVHLFVPEKGKPNYMILKEGEGEESSVSIALKKVLVRNLMVHYYDEKSRILLDIHAVKTSFKGNFSSEIYGLKAKGSVKINNISIGQDQFFSGQEAWMDVVLDINNLDELYSLRRAMFEIEGLPFMLTGSVSDKAGQENLDLNIEGNRLKIEHLFGLLPTKYQEVAKLYTPSGGISFHGTVRGGYSKGNFPHIHFEFGIVNGRIANDATGQKIQDIELEGALSYDSESSSLIIKDLKAKLGQGEVSGSISLIDFDHPVLKLNLTVDLMVSEIAGFLPDKMIAGGEGSVKGRLLAETSISFTKQWNISQLMNSKMNGEVTFSQVSLVLSDELTLLSGINGVLLFDNNDVKVNDLTFGIRNSVGRFSGYFRNMIPYLMMENQLLECQGALSSSLLDLHDLLLPEATNGEDGSVSAEVKLPTNIIGHLNLKLDRVDYEGFTAEMVSGKINIIEGKVYAEDIKMQAFDGFVSGSVLLSQHANKGLGLEVEMNVAKVDISKMFHQFNNFGQDDLVDKNLKGMLTGRFRIFSKLSPGLVFILPTLEAAGDVIVEDGALLNYEPVKTLSKYIRVEDLSDIRFRTLKNEIKIIHQKIIIPEMLIRSDAVDLSLSGTQTFDGVIEYHIKLRLSELISNSIRKDRTRQRLKEESDLDNTGRMNIYITVEGTVDHPVVKYDSKGQAKKIKQELEIEREGTREILKKEFSNFIRSEERTEKKKKATEGEIRIEWDD